MRNKPCAGVLAVFVLFPMLSASVKEKPTNGYQQGTVLKVERELVRSPDQCCYNPGDAPLRTEYYEYDVSVRVKCTTYQGRYETPWDYFPSAFSPGEVVPVRLTKHVMYLDVREGRDLKMNIMHHSNDRAAYCRSH